MKREVKSTQWINFFDIHRPDCTSYCRGSQTFFRPWSHFDIWKCLQPQPRKKNNMQLTAKVYLVYFFIWGYGSQLQNILTVCLIVFSTVGLWQSIANESLMRWVCLIYVTSKLLKVRVRDQQCLTSPVTSNHRSIFGFNSDESTAEFSFTQIWAGKGYHEF